jgi:hypothetical protein
MNFSGVGLTESKLLERTAVRLGVEQVHDDELESNPAAVDGEVLPVDGIEGDGVDVGGEEAAELAEDLLDTDTHGTLGIGEELDKVRWFAVSNTKSKVLQAATTYCMSGSCCRCCRWASMRSRRTVPRSELLGFSSWHPRPLSSVGS